jgi:hypothetical protein
MAPPAIPAEFDEEGAYLFSGPRKLPFRMYEDGDVSAADVVRDAEEDELLAQAVLIQLGQREQNN